MQHKEIPPQACFSFDRAEGALAVLMQGETEYIIPRAALPAGAKQGQLFYQDDTGGYQLAEDATKARQAQMRTRLDALLQRGTKKE